MTDKPPEALWIPLYGMFYADPKTYAGMTSDQRAALQRDYTAERILAIYDALTWALEHPDFPFLQAFPGKFPPTPTYDNSTIVAFLSKFRDGMKPVVDTLRPS